jgi:Holliday junction resolvase-like predicted endonuclease
MGKIMSIQKGKTGLIHGVEVKARSQTQAPTVKVDTATADGRKAVLKAAETVYEQHQSVIKALANR